MVQAFEKEQEKNKTLQEAYDKLLEENKLLKSTDNKVTAEKNEKSILDIRIDIFHIV